MGSDSQALSEQVLAVAGFIADGSAVDWSEAESGVDPAFKGQIKALRTVANIAAVHRGSRSSIQEEEAPWVTLPTAQGSGDSPPSSAPTSKTWWGPLEILEKVGEGAFGAIYRVRDPRLDRVAALKLLHPHTGGAKQAPDATLHEARLLARIKHPNVATVYGADQRQGRVGFWMEYVEGRTLSELLEHQGPCAAREAMLMGLDLCRALAAVHGQGVIHRDVKAQNVMREAGGRILLVDFGVGLDVQAREGDHTLSGTPLYLAPELFAGAPATVQSDLYSLGVLLYHLVTGMFPVRGGSFDALAAAHAQGHRHLLRDVRPDLPDGFIRAVERALATDPQKRPATAGAMERDLGAALEQEEATLSQVRMRPRQRRPWRRWWRLASWFALPAVALTAALLLWRLPEPCPDCPRLWVQGFTADQARVEEAASLRRRVLRSLRKGGWGRLVSNSVEADAILDGKLNLRVEGDCLDLSYSLPDGPEPFRVERRCASHRGESIDLDDLPAFSPAEVTSSSPKARFHIAAANAAHAAEELDLAVRYLDRAIALDPNCARAYAQKAIYLGGLGRFREALEASRKAKDLIEKSSARETEWEKHFIRGSYYAERLQYELAMPEFAAAAGQEIWEADPHRQLAHLEVFLGDMPAALKTIDNAIGASGRESVINWGMKVLLLAQDRQMDQALTTLQEAQEALAGLPEDDRVYLFWGEALIYLVQGDETKARQAIAALDAGGKFYISQANLFDGQLAILEGRLEDAIETLRGGIAFDGQKGYSKNLWLKSYRIGMVSLLSEDPAEAHQSLMDLEALDDVPTYLRALRAAGLLAFRLGETERGEAALERVEALAMEYDSQLAGGFTAHLRGELLAAKGDFELAINSLNDALEAWNDDEIRASLVRLRMHREEWTKARWYLDQILERKGYIVRDEIPTLWVLAHRDRALCNAHLGLEKEARADLDAFKDLWGEHAPDIVTAAGQELESILEESR